MPLCLGLQASSCMAMFQFCTRDPLLYYIAVLFRGGEPCQWRAQVFQVDAVECWLVQQPEPEDVPLPGKAGGSVLDRCTSYGSYVHFLSR